MSSTKTNAHDADWLAENVPGKTLLKAVEKLMGKKRAKKSSDGASVSSREMNPAMRAHLDRTSKISALLRQFKEEVKSGDREFDMDDYPKGIHLRVVSYLESEGTADEIIEAEDLDAIEAAVNFLVENPDWKREAKPSAKKSASAAKGKSKGKEIDLSDSESEEEEKPKAKKSAAKKEEKPKKAAAPKKAADSDSDSEDEKPVVKPAAKKEEKPAAKPAAKPKGKEIDLSDSESEDEKPKPKAAAKPAKPADSDSEDEQPRVKKVQAKKVGGAAAAGGAVRLDDMVKVTHEERGDLFWDQEGDHSLYDAEGKRVGSTEDGTEFVFA